MGMYVHIYEEPFSKNMISELSIDIATWLFGLAFNAFWKRALQLSIINIITKAATCTIISWNVLVKAKQCTTSRATQCFLVKYIKDGNWIGPLAQPDWCTIETRGQVP